MSITKEAMEDALLLHVSECSECLTTAMAQKERLADRGCLDFQRLAAGLQVASETPETLAIGEGHLHQDTLEEYCFGRLSPTEREAADRHIDKCARCRSAVAGEREFVSCLKHALKSWTAPISNAAGIARPKFAAEALKAAQEKVPVSRLAGLDAIRLLQRERTSLDQLERVLKSDPVLSAHLIRVANSALFSYGQEVRTVSHALARIGLDRARLHICGLAVKRMYSSPQLQRIWNHSIAAAQICRQLAGMTRALAAEEASLIALVHDIGHIVLANLGAVYERARNQKLSRGAVPIEVEKELTGATHAGIGADLLSEWAFPADMVEAVRFHHTPSDRVSPLAGLLYVSECWLDNQEDTGDVNLHRSSMWRLGLTRTDLQRLSVKDSPDLELLRFAA